MNDGPRGETYTQTDAYRFTYDIFGMPVSIPNTGLFVEQRLGSFGFCGAEFFPSQSLRGGDAFARSCWHPPPLRGGIERTKCSQSRINVLESFPEYSMFGGKCLDNRL